MKQCVHFVGFRDDRYWNAVKLWGLPDFVHPIWDNRAKFSGDIALGDVVIFAVGSDADEPKMHSWNDSDRF